MDGRTPVDDTHVNVLVPADKLSTSRGLVDVAGALLDSYGGSATILGVVTVPPERSLSEAALLARRRRELLRRAATLQDGAQFRADVRSSHSVEDGIREAVRDTAANLLLLNWNPRRRRPSPLLNSLVEDPPCDLALIKEGSAHDIRKVLIPARGGPHARLGLRLAEAFAARHGAILTLMHISATHWSTRRREIEDRYFQLIRSGVKYENVQVLQIDADSVEAALLEHGADHDVVIMGAAAHDQASSFLLGRIPSVVAEGVQAHVIVVKTREPVTGSSFAGGALDQAPHHDISQVVDRWFAENTFHSKEFRALRSLIDLKERQGLTISLALPTLNEEKTVGNIIRVIKQALFDRMPLLDEIVVIDSESSDRTVEIAEAMDVPAFQHSHILPQHGSFRGKGEGLWKSLFVTRGDIVVWIDSDITGIHPKFVYGLIGPLLSQPHLGFVKGFYRRPLNLGGQIATTGGGRVTELTARPMINLFYPRLSGLVQPLAGEMAGRREVLEAVPFFTGYGVETGLLIDILEQFGLRSIAQTDLEERIHRNQSLLDLSKMAFAIVQVVMERVGERERVQMLEEINTTMKLIHYAPEELYLEEREIREHERPPMNTLEEYATRAAPTRSGRGAASSTTEVHK
jgi:glucosyl-3-phosphoglycerate synthase